MTSSTSYSFAEDYKKYVSDPLDPRDGDYLNQWCDDATVADAITKGLKLRESKANQKKRLKSLRVAGSDKRKKRPLRRHKSSKIARPVRSSSQMSTMTVPTQSWLKKKRHESQKLKCPVRVALLAVPSKRHCLETWRSKYHSLPEVMVERLKKHVMDETPLVTVEDAVTCFKSVKSRPVIKRPVKMTSNPRVYRRRLFGNYCETFANRVARKMITTQKFNLNPQLEWLSKVISQNLKGLLKQVYSKNGCGYQTKKIHKEMSNKIAVWIANIMEDTKDKLLEEDLRVQRIVDRRTENRAMTVTMIQQQVCDCSQGVLSELEEEEGPALDAMDDLIHGVMKICIPNKLTYSSDEEPPRFEFPPYEEESSISSKLDQWFTTSDFRSDPHATTINYDKTDVDESTTPLDLNSTYHVNKDEFTKEADTIELDETDDDLTDDVEDTQLEYVESDQNDLTNEVTQSNTDGADDTNTLYVNNVVKEPTEQLVAPDNMKTHSQTPSVTFRQEPESEEKSPRTVIFGPLNVNLLSEADEIWPKSLVTTDGKLTDSVSKSVTSLGNILEMEEKFSAINVCTKEDSDKEEELTVTLTEFEHKSSESNTDIVQNQKMEMQEILNVRVPSSTTPTRVDGHSGEGWPLGENGSFRIDGPCDYDIPDPTALNANTSHHLASDENTLNHDKHKPKQTAVEQSTNTLPRSPSAVLVDMCVGTSRDKVLINQQTEPNDEFSAVSAFKKISEVSDISSIFDEWSKQSAAREKKSNKQKDKLEPACLVRDKLNNIGLGDHSDADHENNYIIENAQVKTDQSKKFDYRVDPATAPAWILSNPSYDSLHTFSKRRFQQTVRQSDVRKWSNMVDHAFANLEQCNNWMDVTCRKILALKKGNECKCKSISKREAVKSEGRKMIKLKKEIDKQAIFWTKLNYRYREQLKMYSRNKITKMQLDATFTNGKDYNQTSSGSWPEVLDEVDKLISWTHRMIVSAEYCVKCNCRKK